MVKKILSNPLFFLSLIILIAIGLRLIPIKNIVFPDSIWFIGPDSWYHMRLADYTMVNWPKVLTNDPFMGIVGYMPLETWIIVGITKYLGIFIHNPLLLDWVGAVLPVLAGVITLIFIYLLLKSLFSSKVALLTCFLVAILPTEFLYRSLFGQADHHSFEVLFTIASLYFLNWNTTKGWIIAGFTTACLLLVWNGGIFFVAIVALWKSVNLLFQSFTLKPNKGSSNSQFFIWIGITFVLTTGVLWVIQDSSVKFTAFKLLILAIIPLFFVFLQSLKERFSLIFAKIFSIKTSLPVNFTTGIAVFWFIVLGIIVSLKIQVGDYTLLKEVVNELKNIFWGWGSTVQEAQPTQPLIWLFHLELLSVFAIGGFLLSIKNRVTSLFMVWAVILILAMYGQRRWEYYAVIPISAFAVYFMVFLYQCFAKFISGKFKRNLIAKAIPVIAFVMLFVVSISLPLLKVYDVANAYSDVNSDTYQAAIWLKDNTPKPFTVSYGPHISIDVSKGIIKTKVHDGYWDTTDEKPSYTILNWWDYGNLIMRVSHRVPESCSASQFHDIQDFFGAQSLEDGAKLLEGSKARYIFTTKDMMMGMFKTVYTGFTENRKYQRDMTNLNEKRANSMIYKLWTSQVEGYKLVYWNDTVRIFEIE